MDYKFLKKDSALWSLLFSFVPKFCLILVQTFLSMQVGLNHTEDLHTHNVLRSSGSGNSVANLKFSYEILSSGR
jgi:hypothetical protein